MLADSLAPFAVPVRNAALTTAITDLMPTGSAPDFECSGMVQALDRLRLNKVAAIQTSYWTANHTRVRFRHAVHNSVHSGRFDHQSRPFDRLARAVPVL